ncbi:ABC transporter permease [Virgibacillus necropolis]|uniref:ABC transporter permease n=1 Tax=Virgibacillus necropolis TaxID=163877 RepID=UPI00384E4F92
MKKVIEARLLHMKKHWISLLFWLLIPLVASIGLTTIFSAVQDDSKIPVGIVIEDHNEVTNELFNEISTTSFIEARDLTKDVALYQLKKHEIDSVFVIHGDFADQIREGKRNHIITSYQSNQSFAYSLVKEMVLSYVQQETGRSKTAYIIKELAENYQSDSEWSWDEIISKSKEIEKEEHLLQTSFDFNKVESKSTKNIPLWNIWGIWSIFSMLSTLLLFDWVVKENHSPVLPRFAFMGISFKGYLVRSFGFYSLLLILMDTITLSVFYSLHHVQISMSFIIGMMCYRLILLLGAFLLALLFKNTFRYYVVSFAITLLTMISSGAILPINGLLSRWPWFTAINPLGPLLSGDLINFWPVFLLISSIIWYVRKEQYYA